METSLMPSQKTDVNRVTAEEVKSRIERGEPILFLDCRNPEAWAASDVRLPGAVRVEADRVAEHLSEIPRGRSIVTYCT